MAREEDHSFSADEPLYRGLQRDEIQGTQVLHSSVEVPCGSVVRSKYGGTAAHALLPEKGRVRVARLLAGAVHAVVVALPDPGSTRWMIAVRDWPIEGDHHAEVQMSPEGTEYCREKAARPGKGMKRALRAAVADRMVPLPEADVPGVATA